MKPLPLGNDSLRLVSYCPLCETRHHPMHARILAEDGEAQLVHVTCKKCGGATLALLLQGESGASTIGLVTDLNHEDVLKFHAGHRITTDDVIEVHEALGGKGLSALLRISPQKRRSRAKSRVQSRRTA